MKKVKVIIALICTVILTGCWDKVELNERAISLAFGLDKDPKTNEIIVTNEIVKPRANQGQQSSSGSSLTEIVSVRGKTAFEARKNLVKRFDRQPYYAHNKIIIISERLARQGLKNVLDRLVRSNEIRPLDWLIIAKGVSPEEILAVKHGGADIPALALNDTIRLKNLHSEAHVLYLQQFVEELLGEGISPSTGVMEISREGKIVDGNEIKLTGTALFKKDKLIGYLSDKETRAMNYVTGDVKKGTVVFPSPVDNEKNVVTSINKAKSSIKPEKKDGKFIFNIKVDITSELSDQQDDADTSDPKIIGLIEIKQNDAIKEDIKILMHKLQDEYQVDSVGFGSALSKKYPKDWEKIKGKWDKTFPIVQYNITVSSRIARTGMLNKPLKIK